MVAARSTIQCMFSAVAMPKAIFFSVLRSRQVLWMQSFPDPPVLKAQAQLKPTKRPSQHSASMNGRWSRLQILSLMVTACPESCHQSLSSTPTKSVSWADWATMDPSAMSFCSTQRLKKSRLSLETLLVSYHSQQLAKVKTASCLARMSHLPWSRMTSKTRPLSSSIRRDKASLKSSISFNESWR